MTRTGTVTSLLGATLLVACATAEGTDTTGTAGSRHTAGSDAIGGTSSGVGEQGGASGSTEGCDCGDARTPQLDRDCACQHGLCTTFEADLASYRASGVRPYCLRLGICANGVRTLTYEWATEQSRTQTYDATGRMLYSKLTGYFSLPQACRLPTSEEVFGSLTIGQEDPASGCTYCLVAADDLLPEGTGTAAGQHYYAGSLTPACEPALLEKEVKIAEDVASS